ncbi:MAG: hypothetical protein U5L96_20410 [Owenweeksia sp.]|nr:hypothetical protein [Owenweeksia sp.]
MWSTGSTDSSITITGPGTYWVEVAYNHRWQQYDTVVVDYHPQYHSGLPPDTVICEGSSIMLRARGQAGVTHRWDNGSTSNNRNITEEGLYMLESYTPATLLRTV